MDDVAVEQAIFENLVLGMPVSVIAACLKIDRKRVYRCELLWLEGSCDFSPAIRLAAAEVKKKWSKRMGEKRKVAKREPFSIRIVQVPSKLRDIVEGDDLLE